MLLKLKLKKIIAPKIIRPSAYCLMCQKLLSSAIQRHINEKYNVEVVETRHVPAEILARLVSDLQDDERIWLMFVLA